MMTDQATRMTKDVDVDLSPGEKHTLGFEIAEHVREYNAIEDRKKTLTRELTKSMKEQRREIDRKSKALLDGKISKPIACEEIRDFDTNRIITKRLDTGAIVGERPMTGAERQREMFADPPDDEDEDDEDDEAPVVEPAKGEAKVRGRKTDPEAH